jgi:hypothetical protein
MKFGHILFSKLILHSRPSSLRLCHPPHNASAVRVPFLHHLPKVLFKVDHLVSRHYEVAQNTGGLHVHPRLEKPVQKTPKLHPLQTTVSPSQLLTTKLYQRSPINAQKMLRSRDINQCLHAFVQKHHLFHLEHVLLTIQHEKLMKV